jgi:hypothetical protein
MSNFLDSTGLHLEALADIVTALETAFKGIYGADINLDSNSPDAQALNLFAQAKIDMLGVIAQVYNSMSPEKAVGVALDQRCALNGVIRRGATYTRTAVTVTTDRVLTLPGLDTYPNAPYTVADASLNQFYLENTTTTINGANTLTFRAAKAGLVATTIATITTQVTQVLGVLTVSNGASAITTGQDEETDVQLRARRQSSVSLPSQGYLPGLVGALKAISGVSDAAVYENPYGATGTTGASGPTGVPVGVPPHSIWPIVDDANDATVDQLVADAIYRKRSAGCGMTGGVAVGITQVDGTHFTVNFDHAAYVNLYVRMTITSIDPAHAPDTIYLANQIYQRISYSIYQPADFTAITTLVKELDPLVVVVGSGGGGTDGVCATNGGTYVPYLYPASVKNRWLLSVNRINITAE